MPWRLASACGDSPARNSWTTWARERDWFDRSHYQPRKKLSFYASPTLWTRTQDVLPRKSTGSKPDRLGSPGCHIHLFECRRRSTAGGATEVAVDLAAAAISSICRISNGRTSSRPSVRPAACTSPISDTPAACRKGPELPTDANSACKRGTCETALKRDPLRSATKCLMVYWN
jgi:hypothetical protein